MSHWRHIENSYFWISISSKMIVVRIYLIVKVYTFRINLEKTKLIKDNEVHNKGVNHYLKFTKYRGVNIPFDGEYLVNRLKK